MGLLCALAFGQAGAVTGAAFTTINANVDGPGQLCLNGNPNNNCNIYTDKSFVWLNGGPSTAYVGDGTYFFAVLDPGSQNDPNDGSTGNLSPPNDAYTSRTFSVTNGVVSYGGTHTFDINKIRLMTYNDTSNPGGVYILAICSLGPNGTTYPVDARDCKYDAFKVQAAQTQAAVVSACKFNDRNDDGIQQGNEPTIPDWPITAFGVDGDTGSGVTEATDETGCTSFTVSNPPGTVTVQEGSLGAGWTQTAPNPILGPYAGYTASATGAGGTPPYVATVPVSSGTTVEVDFGNFNPLCSQPGTCGDEPGLDISKTAGNTTTWTITKAVDKTLVEQIGGTATFNYTVNVGYTVGSVTGTITVSNNSPADINVSSLADSLGGCSFTAPTIVHAGDSVPVSYTCSLGSDTTNTATVTWNDFGGGTANTGAVAITLSDTCVTVTDTLKGSLGSVCNTATNPTAIKYSLTFNVPTSNCVKYTNTATFTTNTTGTTGSDSKTVEVCGPAAVGALTMGFWQNNNGQAIITGQAATGVCPSATSLRQYAPFQDLSATSTCKAVATYVTNVIKAASCTSSTNTCNTMLKAQMLATALDVYFSDPTLGGNKIGAAAPVGGVSIDLTKICTNIPTCTSFENDSSVFGGSTSLTVSQILTYAAGQSNVGGSTWYGQVKAKQVMAKDVFDAINNAKAFSP